jgi:hypothetical protein
VFVKTTTIPILGLLYKKGWFNGKAPFMLREIATVSILVGYCFAGEFALNELMWGKVREDVKLFGKIKQ